MGSLEPGAIYVYEREENRIYARKFGEQRRQLVGWTESDSSVSMREYRSEINSVLLMCESDPGMRRLLDQLFVMYNLKKTHE